MTNFQMKDKYSLSWEPGNRDAKEDPFAAVTTPVTAHDRYNECRSPGLEENEIGTSGDLIIYKKLKRLTGIFIGCV